MGCGAVEIAGRDIFIALHPKTAPADADWGEWTALLEAYGKAHAWNLGNSTNLVVTDGGAPSTAQRTTINTLIAQAKSLPSVAIVTDSAVVRGIVRALSIFNPRVRVFSPSDIVLAGAHLGLAPRDLPALISTCDEIESAQLGRGAVESLQAIRRAPVAGRR